MFQNYKSSDEPVPGYRLVRFLGKGNFGEVWMASAPGNKKVALKIIDLRGREGLQESKAIERIKDINHAHLVSIFAYWVIDDEGRILDDQSIERLALGSSAVKEDKPASATMLVDPLAVRPVELIVAMSLGSQNLSDSLEEYRNQQVTGIPVDVLLDYMEDAAKGIDYLNLPIHDLGKGPLPIIHGDIKPQNLLIVGNSLQICDFGLARSIDEFRKTATAMGSYAYAAPELLMGHPHVRSDQYCLAVSYIELRTGELPLFGATNILKIAELHRDGKLDLSGLGPNEAEVIRRATHPDPHERWPTCREMVRELRTAVDLDLAGKPPRRSAEPFDAANTRTGGGSQTTMGKREPRRRTNRLVFTAMLVLIIGGLTAAAVWWDRWRKPVEKNETPPVIAKLEEPKPPDVEKPLKPEPSATAPSGTATSTVPEHTAKPPALNPPVKPAHAEKPVVANWGLWQARLKSGLYLAERAYIFSASSRPKMPLPPPVIKVKPPQAAPFIAEARTEFAAGQFAAARKALAAARGSLKQAPDAGLSRQTAMWEEAVALVDPDSSEANRSAAADAVKADGKDLGDFYVELYDFVLANRAASTLFDRSPWFEALLDNAISFKAGPPPAKAVEPFAPASDPALRRLYRDRAERKLLRGDGNLDRAVADSERAGAAEMLADALGRRAPRQKSRELIVADIDAAIEGGKKSKTAYGLADVAAAYALRANYDNHPAYSREARENDLDAAAKCLRRANDLNVGVPASAGSSSQPPKGGTPAQYLYLLAAARAHEDLARLDEKAPAFNINRAVRMFANAAKSNPQSPRPSYGIGRCLYHSLADMYLPPGDLNRLEGDSFDDEFQVADECEHALRTALGKDATAIEAAENLARLDHFRSATHYDRFLDGAGGDELAKAKECSAKADQEYKAAWDLAQKQNATNGETCALQWALFPQHDARMSAAPNDRRAEIRKRLEVLERATPPPDGTSDRQRTLALGRGRLAELEGKYDDAVKSYSSILPPNLTDIRDENADALLARAEARLAGVVKRLPDNLNWTSQAVPFDTADVSSQQIEALRTAADEADAASRAAGLPKDRIRAAELKLTAHVLLYFAATNAAERSNMYAKGLGDIAYLRNTAPRRPREFRWCAAWAHVAFAQLSHVGADRSVLLKNYTNAILWADRAVEACRRKTSRADLQSSLLKPYVEAALKFADGYLNRTPAPNPPFRTDLEKKRREWQKMLAGLTQEK